VWHVERAIDFGPFWEALLKVLSSNHLHLDSFVTTKALIDRIPSNPNLPGTTLRFGLWSIFAIRPAEQEICTLSLRGL